MTKFLSRLIPTTVILTVSLGGMAVAEDIRPGLTADRLVVRDPGGSVQFYVERTLNGHLVIKDTSGSIINWIEEGRRSTRGGQSRLTLPRSWSSDVTTGNTKGDDYRSRSP